MTFHFGMCILVSICCNLFLFWQELFFFMTMFHSPRTHKFHYKSQNTNKKFMCKYVNTFSILNEYFFYFLKMNSQGFSCFVSHTSSSLRDNRAEKSSTVIDFNFVVSVLLPCCWLDFVTDSNSSIFVAPPHIFSTICFFFSHF